MPAKMAFKVQWRKLIPMHQILRNIISGWKSSVSLAVNLQLKSSLASATQRRLFAFPYLT
jgi:hypothetical protein